MSRFGSNFIATGFLSIHYGTLLYVNSSLLGNFFDLSTVSMLFILGALGSITIFLFTGNLIEWFGKRLLLIFFLLITFFATLGLAFAQSPYLVIVSFLVYSSSLLTIYYCLDIFLEEISRDTNTGEIRGIYLTLINFGMALGPLILAMLATDGQYGFIYFVSAIVLIPPTLFAIFSFKSKNPKWHGIHHRHIFLPFAKWWHTKSLRVVTLARLVLELFFGFMIIYTPVYLHNGLGFEWSELGIIFTFTLLPFVLFQWPAGELADRFFGEKEIMSIGFVITSISLLIMPFIGKVFLTWLIILFISRVGASLVEVMTESYFFKHVGKEDTGMISIFRLMRPLGIVLGAGFGFLSLSVLTFEKTLFILAAIVLFGLKESLSLKDTK